MTEHTHTHNYNANILLRSKYMCSAIPQEHIDQLLLIYYYFSVHFNEVLQFISLFCLTILNRSICNLQQQRKKKQYRLNAFQSKNYGCAIVTHIHICMMYLQCNMCVQVQNFASFIIIIIVLSLSVLSSSLSSRIYCKRTRMVFNHNYSFIYYYCCCCLWWWWW